MPKAQRSKQKRSIAACKSRVTKTGVPYTCYTTKAQRCEALALAGKHSYQCAAGGGLYPKSRKAGPRRPVGDPIDPCVATRDDLEKMTVKQITDYIRRYKGPDTDPLDPVDRTTGLRKNKADWIEEALALAQTCPASYPFGDIDKATTRELGLALKYKGIKPPRLGNPAICGVLKKSRGGRGDVWHSRPCKAELAAMVKEKYQPLMAAVTATAPQIPTPLAAIVQVKPQGSPAAAQVVVEVKPQQISGVVAKPESPLPSQPKELPLAETKGKVQQSVDPLTAAKTIQFDFSGERLAEGKSINDAVMAATYNAYGDSNAYVIDSACGADVEEGGRAAIADIDFAGYLFQSCKIISGDRVCGTGVLYARTTDTQQKATDFKTMLAQYVAYDRYTKDLGIVLPFERAWQCRGKTDMTYPIWKYNGEQTTPKREAGMISFMALRYPGGVGPHMIMSLRTFMRETMSASRRRMPLDEVKNIVKKLFDKIVATGYGPAQMEPEFIGIAIHVDGTPQAFLFPGEMIVKLPSGADVYPGFEEKLRAAMEDEAEKLNI